MILPSFRSAMNPFYSRCRKAILDKKVLRSETPVDATFFYTSPPKEPLECVAMEIATDLNSASVT